MPTTLCNLISVLALASAAACTTTGPKSEPASTAPSASNRPDEAQEVIALRYAQADELAGVLASSMAGRRVRILPYPRTNSLVVVGDRAEIEATKSLVAVLDVETKK